jgi:4-oxalomesaconate hydratase
VTDPRSMVVVSAHAADFVWRAAGAVALHTQAGGVATVVSLSFGERGESGDLWREPGQTVAAVRQRRSEEAAKAAAELGADFAALDLGDYPLRVGDEAIGLLVDIYLDRRPDVLLIHAPADPFNPDHPVASAAASRARLLAMGAGGAPAAFPTIPPPLVYAFEPHLPEQCAFVPDRYVDITPVIERKRAAMAAMAAQSFLAAHYEQRAEQRAMQSRYFGAGPQTRYAEAFMRLTPELGVAL